LVRAEFGRFARRTRGVVCPALAWDFRGAEMAEEYNLERLNFLIVDDNKHMRALIKTLLHALGAKNCHEAMDGADAFKELRHFPADIIICDWNMSPLDGIDFVRLVRTGKDSPNPYVPIIMLTGHTELAKVVEARDSGVHEFLAKPISAKSVYSRVKSILENPRPFVQTATYFGPDRRRQQIEWKGKERRKASQDVQEDAGSLSQDEVEALLNN
jgi:two-component system chemotaxis response regulator CheY